MTDRLTDEEDHRLDWNRRLTDWKTAILTDRTETLNITRNWSNVQCLSPLSIFHYKSMSQKVFNFFRHCWENSVFRWLSYKLPCNSPIFDNLFLNCTRKRLRASTTLHCLVSPHSVPKRHFLPIGEREFSEWSSCQTKSKRLRLLWQISHLPVDLQVSQGVSNILVFSFFFFPPELNTVW